MLRKRAKGGSEKKRGDGAAERLWECLGGDEPCRSFSAREAALTRLKQDVPRIHRSIQSKSLKCLKRRMNVVRSQYKIKSIESRMSAITKKTT